MGWGRREVVSSLMEGLLVHLQSLLQYSWGGEWREKDTIHS